MRCLLPQQKNSHISYFAPKEIQEIELYHTPPCTFNVQETRNFMLNFLRCKIGNVTFLLCSGLPNLLSQMKRPCSLMVLGQLTITINIQMVSLSIYNPQKIFLSPYHLLYLISILAEGHIPRCLRHIMLHSEIQHYLCGLHVHFLNTAVHNSTKISCKHREHMHTCIVTCSTKINVICQLEYNIIFYTYIIRYVNINLYITVTLTIFFCKSVCACVLCAHENFDRYANKMIAQQ